MYNASGGQVTIAFNMTVPSVVQLEPFQLDDTRDRGKLKSH